MNHLESQRKLAPIGLGSNFDSDLAVVGHSLDDVQDTINSTLDLLLPDNDNFAFHASWERVLGLSSAGANADRQRRILLKLRERGGLNITYFYAVAATLGYNQAPTIPYINIRLGYPPFRCDFSLMDVDSFGDEVTLWQWYADVYGVASDSVLEAAFNRLKPPHTEVVFAYL